MKHATLEAFTKAWKPARIGLINTHSLALSKGLAKEMLGDFELTEDLQGSDDLFANDKPLLYVLEAPTKQQLQTFTTWAGRPLLLIGEKLKITFPGEYLELLAETLPQKQKRLELLFKKSGKTVDAGLLRDLSGLPEEMLELEIEKLITFAGEKEHLSSEECECLSVKFNSTTVWAFLDALLDGKTALALSLGMKLEKDSFFGLLKLVRAQVKNLLILKTLQAAPYSERRQALHHLKDRNFANLEASLKRFSLEGLEKRLTRLDLLDFKIRDGLDDFNLMMTLLVAC